MRELVFQSYREATSEYASWVGNNMMLHVMVGLTVLTIKLVDCSGFEWQALTVRLSSCSNESPSYDDTLVEHGKFFRILISDNEYSNKVVEIVKVSVRLKTIKTLLEEQYRVRGEDLGDYKIYIMKDYRRLFFNQAVAKLIRTHPLFNWAAIL